jgi:hypothetical protein
MTNLEHHARVAARRAAAIKRIESLMAPGYKALCATRNPDDPYWIERDVTCGRVKLSWRSQATHGGAVQVIAPEDVQPEELVEAAVVAKRETRKIERECAAKAAACFALCEALVAAYDEVGADA